MKEAEIKSVHNFIHNSHNADRVLHAFFNKLLTSYPHPNVDNLYACPSSREHAMMPSQSS
jgi:hypothetical protein